ncbi:hypothetical protein [Streptomyces sp. NPDC047928]|uniref:hypothetical protein n=1 Tax=unclassified Streptomyces TaxID=2593676 RepID=UPI003715F55C
MHHHAHARAFRRLTGALLGALMVLASMVASTGPAQAVVAPPGGKTNWVVSVGGLNTPDRNSYRNWVRLGYYVFGTDGTVTTTYWAWNQQDRPRRQNVMTADCGGNVPQCPIRTVAGFQNSPQGGFTGTYELVGDRLTVHWTKNAAGSALLKPLTEYWNVETGLADGGVARITSPTYYGAYTTTSATNVVIPESGANGFSNYTATFGIGYGSNAPLDGTSRASMDQLRDDPRYNAERYRGAFVVAKDLKMNGSDTASHIVGREGAGGDWTFGGTAGNNPRDPWRKCLTAECIGYLQPGTSCSAADTDRVRYIGQVGGGRRNTEEYWCQALAQGAQCYDDNSHPRPMLQVIDDSGRFQGWVGVEAFTHVNTQTQEPTNQFGSDYWGVFDMVSVSALRPQVAYPDISQFEMAYGSSLAYGHLQWNAGSLTYKGTHRVYSGCRFVEVTATAADGTTRRGSSSPLCPGSVPGDTAPFAGQLLDIAADSVRVTYWVSGDGGKTYATKNNLVCTRSGGCVTAPREPVTQFQLSYGNSVTKGSLTWREGSVVFEGNNHVASGCRYVAFEAVGTTNRGTSSLYCSVGDRPFGPQVVNLGGATSVKVTYYATSDSTVPATPVASATCTRDGCVA